MGKCIMWPTAAESVDCKVSYSGVTAIYPGTDATGRQAAATLPQNTE